MTAVGFLARAVHTETLIRIRCYAQDKNLLLIYSCSHPLRLLGFLVKPGQSSTPSTSASSHLTFLPLCLAKAEKVLVYGRLVRIHIQRVSHERSNVEGDDSRPCLSFCFTALLLCECWNWLPLLIPILAQHQRQGGYKSASIHPFPNTKSEQHEYRSVCAIALSPSETPLAGTLAGGDDVSQPGAE